MAVASAGPDASLHLAPDRQPHQHPTTQVDRQIDIDRYFINDNKKNNNCELKQYGGRLPGGILHQSWSPEHTHTHTPV